MTIDYLAIAPEITLTVTALVVLLADLVLTGRAKSLANPLSMLGTLFALVFTALQWGRPAENFGGSFVVNDFAVIFKLMFLGALLAILLISYRYFAEGRYYQGEYYVLLLTSFVGMIVMPSARDLVLLFIALETVSIPAFVMAGMRKRDLYSSEGAIKFFLIGVVSVALMLFGMSMIYGFTGTTSLAGIADALAANSAPEPLLLSSMLLVIVGFGFKVSAVPFHFWAPDTYAGAPIPVTAMLAVASKAAGFSGLLLVTFIAFEPLADVWAPVIGVLAVLTMTLGNLLALQQRDVIRLLGYSSIAQAGYMLVPFGVAEAGNAVVNQQAAAAVLIYLVAYAVMNIGAFGVVIAVHRRTGERSISQYAGLGQRSPVLAVAMTAFLLSLGGAIPMVGFWAKYYVFFSAVSAGSTQGIVLGSFVAVNAVISFFYYLRIAKTMWMDPAAEDAPTLQPALSTSFAVTVLAAATIVLAVVPGVFTDPTVNSGLIAGG